MAPPLKNQNARKYEDKDIQELCKEIVEWAINEKDIHLIGYAIKKKKTPSWINWMVKRYPEFKKAKENATAILGYKILNASFFDKKVNAYVGMQYLGIYDQDLKDFMKFKASLQKDTASRDLNKCIFNEEVKKLKEEITSD